MRQTGGRCGSGDDHHDPCVQRSSVESPLVSEHRADQHAALSADGSTPAALPAGEKPFTVLVYSDDSATRGRIMLALGPRPAKDLPRVQFHEVATEPMVHRIISTGDIDLAILDGEAWPAGGMGICRQLKDEQAYPPPTVVIVGRPDDRWLATWSMADGVVSHPIDPPTLVEVVVGLLRAEQSQLPTR
jgi:CheY-like chemotaxis protein